ncbi:MAG: hypothetical protein EA383_10100 [Spirochaetaceae bacterium]|nr:MAG: hypothetical protein EA383_10100 [Spirochaetaceae bacterium]
MIFNRSVTMRARFLLFCVLLTAQALPVLAFGAREDPVAQAEELIEQNRFNDAATLLREVVRRQPERFDEAEALFRRIRQVRGRYNDLWQELIFILENEPDNVERAFRVIAEMETIDDAPSAEAVAEFQQWRNIVVLRFNLDSFEQINAEASQAIRDARYVDALLTYREGLGLFREEFESLPYADDLGPRAFEIEVELSVAAETLGSLAVSLQAAVERYVDAISVEQIDEESVSTAVSEVRNRLTDYFEAEIRLAALGSELIELGQEASRRRAMNDPDPYLTFTAWFAFGRTAAGGREGLFGAARAIANEQIGLIFASGPPDARERVAVADGYIAERVFDVASSAWRESATAFRALDDILSALDAWETFRSQEVPDLSRAAVETRAGERAVFRFGTESSATTAELTELWADVSMTYTGTEDDLDSWSSVAQSYRDALEVRDRFRGFSEMRTEADGRADDIAEISVRSIEQMVEDIAELDREILANLFENRFAEYSPRYDELVERQESAEVIAFVGVDAETPGNIPDRAVAPPEDDTEDLLLFRYPDIASERMNAVLAESEALEEDLQTTQDLFDEANEPVRTDTDVQDARGRIDELLRRLRGLQADVRIAIEDADERFAESLLLQDEVVATLNDAESLVENDPDSAQTLFDFASDMLVESLDLRQDPVFRSEMDNRLAALGSEIQEARFRIIIVEVRDMIEEGRRLYRQDSFGDAESVLIEARERWNSVNDEENTEVQFWLRLTQSALNLQGDRDLTETDPLFRPLAGYLSLAFDAFERAQAAREAGNEAQSEQLLSRAEDNIQAVVSARPFNQEARVLSLRIARLNSPDEFPAIFEQRYQQALSRAEVDPLSALNDLYDLQEINPDFPGMTQSIERLEIAAGIREPPVDQTALNRSTQLVNQARQVWQRGVRETAERAQGLLQEALELNPENRNAISLLDQVRLDLGSTTAATLSTTGLQQLRQAENLYLDGSIGRAIVIVERLWQEEDNRRYSPLSDLRNRLLGQ